MAKDDDRGLVEIRERLRSGQIEKGDLARLEAIVRDAEESISRLRAAVIE